MYIVLIYDINIDDNGAKASRNIFKICKKYLTHVQKSVFEGDIILGLLQKLKIEVSRHIRKDKDSVIVFRSRDERWMQKEFLGKKDDKTSNFF